MQISAINSSVNYYGYQAKNQAKSANTTPSVTKTINNKTTFGSGTSAQWAAAMRRYNIRIPQENSYVDSNSILAMLDKKNSEISDKSAQEAAKLQRNLSEIFANIKIKNEKCEKSNIGSLRQIGKNNAYTGSMRDAAVNMDEVKKMGIKRIVSFCLPSETNIEKACKDNNIDFHYFYVPQIFEYDMTEKGRKEIQSHMKGSFAKVVDAVRKGDCIIGCESGNQRTGIMAAILSFLDPKSSLKVPQKDIPEQSKFFASIISQSLTEAEKASLGYTQDFGNKIVKMLKKYC